MEEYTPENQPSEEEHVEESDQFKRWFQDNLRIIISVVIVVLIAGGIYSYSKRTDSSAVSDNSASTTQSTTDQSQPAATSSTDSSASASTNNTAAVTPASTSQETATSFVETAAKGDNLTILARHATADYLEKNQDSSLTKEHKIYIEDYLRKHVTSAGNIHVGTSVEFSKDLISQAIAQAKTLTPRQLQNLQKYSARVTSI